MSRLPTALALAISFETKGDAAEAARLLDEALAAEPQAALAHRFRALVVRADLACTLGDLIESRGILAEALQIRLDPAGKAEASAEIRRADALETFLTHRGCAG